MGIAYDFAARVVPFLAILAFGYAFVLPLYRVYFSPLSRFPGPKLAAATLWYEFYYDVILNGHYTFKIAELHKEYAGPIIRISPFELHIQDPDYYDVLYSNNLPVNKSKFYTSQFDMDHTAFSTLDHKHHRLRRSALNPFFSKQMINRLEPLLQTVVNKLSQRLEEFRGTGTPVEMRAAYSALTIDVITYYCFNESWAHLDAPDFRKDWFDGVHTMLLAGNFMKHYPWLYDVIKALPQRLVCWLIPVFRGVLMYEDRIRTQTERVLAAHYANKNADGDGLDTTIMHAFLKSDLPPEEKTALRIWSEGMSVVGAGSETSANTLATMHFHLLNSPDVLARLQTELKDAFPDKNATIMLSQAEKLPYLTAVINEGLSRLSSGVASRLGRNLPTSSMRYKDWVIPAGTSVGMTPLLINMDPTIFLNPTKFSPERWLTSKSLDKYMVAFSRGTRMCLGLNLAKAELYLTVATIFRRFDNMELFETTSRDVVPKHDHFIPHPEMDSKGIRVVYK
ncbi:cytochrome P450 [Mollisia scopiformis]|uniref:Cytochrome P450 n=1 Tax=Mollisia scopiformis TaxID=149040 RepID=A0A194X0K6_MOLSC|nr:cytochrome P450 [Mollisia scopiformis]KUJ13489.1 cytochrome P450 [Mollisia scopiformis]